MNTYNINNNYNILMVTFDHVFLKQNYFAIYNI